MGPRGLGELSRWFIMHGAVRRCAAVLLSECDVAGGMVSVQYVAVVRSARVLIRRVWLALA